MTNILITGYSGFIGGRLAQYLNNSGRYRLFLAGRKQVAAITGWQNSTQVQYDLRDPQQIFDKVDKIDALIHLAGINEVECSDAPIRAVELNTLAAFKLFEGAAKLGIKRVIYFSTAHVYGRPLAGNLSEKSVPRPVHPYAYSHHAAEDYVIAGHEDRKFAGIVMRLSNSFGAPLFPEVNRWTLLINDACRQIAEKNRVVMRSRGQQYRNFITLSDVCRATEHLIDLPSEQIGDCIFNVGGMDSIQIIKMVELIASRAKALFDRTPDIEMPEHEVDSHLSLNYSSEKLLSTGFKISNDIVAEIDLLLQFCRRHFGGGSF